MDIEDFANDPPHSHRITVLSGFLVADGGKKSPVDQYLNSQREILLLGSKEMLEAHNVLGRLLIVGLVSAVEAYVRAILSACLELCPVCRKHASKQNIPLGGVLWHGVSGFSRSAFEHNSFASRDELTSAFKKYLNLDLPDKRFGTVLSEFEQICQLRHGIVHGDGLLPGRNAVLLDIEKFEDPMRIVARFQELQDVAAVLNMTVLSLNRFLFPILCQRWAEDWRNRVDWKKSMSGRLFTQVWDLFHSTNWATTSGLDSNTLKAACKKQLIKKYNIS